MAPGPVSVETRGLRDKKKKFSDNTCYDSVRADYTGTLLASDGPSLHKMFVWQTHLRDLKVSQLFTFFFIKFWRHVNSAILINLYLRSASLW